ncbi:MAG: DNA repair exonuclease [Acidobacteria bacterium]|nr:MAG: DNA repair exonuclease [Acidobacteriota bacterium]
MAIRLLAIGDIHLGRLPGGLPEDLAETGLDARSLGPAAALDRAVEEALDRRVDAVLLAGDVVDQDNAFFEALEPLEGALGRLAAAGIRAFAVAGNHDARVLPRLAAAVDGLRLLGADGRWEIAGIEPEAGGGLAIVGRSFPGPCSGPVPVEDLEAVISGKGVPVLGLLHADLDGPPDSPYAPVSSTDLQRAPVDLWLVGHVHRPSAVAPGARPGYLGSLSPLDPGETGRRGPWLVTWEQGRLSAEPLALAPLRFEVLALEPRRVQSAAPEAVVLDAVTRLVERLDRSGELETLHALGVRLRVAGEVDDPARVADALGRLDVERLRRSHRGVSVFVESLTLELSPALDLDRLAEGTDPLGALARLAAAGPPDDALRADVRERLERLAAEVRGAGGDLAVPGEDALAGAIRGAAGALLAELAGRAEDDG